MIEIMNISEFPFQKHNILTADAPVDLELRFYPKARFWTLGVQYEGKRIDGVKLTTGVLHIRSQNFPFDFVVSDKSNTGIDPFKADDFASGRCRLLMLERDDMESIRGQPVPI